MGASIIQSEQPDLFCGNASELKAEVRRHGGGVPPRYVMPAEDEGGEEAADFSPVQIAEARRDRERRFDTVSIRRVSLDRLFEQLL